jgi:hypothetical protein
MRWLRGISTWGLCPQTPGIYRFFPARMAVYGGRECEGGIGCRPLPFRPLSRSLGLLPSIALSRPTQVWPVSTQTISQLQQKAASGKLSEVFLSHPRGAVTRLSRGGRGVGDKLSELPSITIA